MNVIVPDPFVVVWRIDALAVAEFVKDFCDVDVFSGGHKVYTQRSDKHPDIRKDELRCVGVSDVLTTWVLSTLYLPMFKYGALAPLFAALDVCAVFVARLRTGVHEER